MEYGKEGSVEIWMKKLDKNKAYIDDNGQKANARDTNEDIKTLGLWLVTQIQKSKGERKHIMKNDKIYQAWIEFINDPKYERFFFTDEEKWFVSLNKNKSYIDDNGEKANGMGKTKAIKILSRWLNLQVKNSKGKRKQIMKNDKIYKAWLDFINDPKYERFFNKSKVGQ